MARNIDTLIRGLSRYLPGGEKITGIKTLSAGHSNETYLIEGLDQILRMPPSATGLLPPYDMERQHSVQKAVSEWRGGVPAPRVFELCLDPDVIGAPFFVMERLDGNVFEFHTPAWLAQGPAHLSENICAQWSNAIFSLHHMPVSHMPPGARTPAQEAQHWLTLAAEADIAQPLLAVLDDLVKRPPTLSGAPTPIHGDPKIGNCLWHEGQLTAILDWEMAMCGDPLMDLGYMLQFYDNQAALGVAAGFELPGWWSRSAMIEAWEQHTGRSARDVDRYELLGMAKVATILGIGVRMFKTGTSTDPRFEAFGIILPRYVDLVARYAETA